MATLTASYINPRNPSSTTSTSRPSYVSLTESSSSGGHVEASSLNPVSRSLPELLSQSSPESPLEEPDPPSQPGPPRPPPATITRDGLQRGKASAIRATPSA